MERAIGTTFKVGNDELIVKEMETNDCTDKRGVKCYFYGNCLTKSRSIEKAGYCTYFFRKDRKNVIFIKK